MFRKFSLIWATLLVGIIGALYVKYIYPEPSLAQQPIDLNEAYNLPSEKIDAWLKNHSQEEVQSLIEEHIENEIQQGAEPVYGTVTLDFDSNQIVMEEITEQGKEESTFLVRFMEFLRSEILSN